MNLRNRSKGIYMHVHSTSMKGVGRMNDASRARSVHRRINEGSEPTDLKNDVEQIRDPYHQSLAYLHLALSPKAEPAKGLKWLELSFDKARSVRQEWRRSELITSLLKKTSQSNPEIKERAEDLSISIIERMEPGSGLSQALRGIAPFIEKRGWPRLLDTASNNRGFENGDIKAVMRSTLAGKDRKLAYELLLKRSGRIKDPEKRAHLLWYLHLQARKVMGDNAPSLALDQALAALKELDGEKAMITFSYLCRNCVSTSDLDELEKVSVMFKDPLQRIKALGNLSTAADRTKATEKASGFLDEARSIVDEIGSNELKVSALMVIASGSARLGHDQIAREYFENALECADREMMPKDKIESQMIKHGLREATSERIEKENTPGEEKERHILALYDTYEGGLKQVHSRAVARAAPLCMAFDLDLALMGFPSDDLNRVVKLSATETNIGKGGSYLRELHSSGRVHLVHCTIKEPPQDWSGLGLPIATTSHPDHEKAVDLIRAKEISKTEHPLGRICLIMGLGRRGLPESLLASVPYHLEITGANIPLETATAMGILAYMVSGEDRV